ncbi:MAG: septal ring lytic transglycosylase RlpA family lipoprotein [Arcobacter sp.]|nr:MAG: septal ring lytic transglycosylase RlpA family lipoprotein [Arcobacter sp.]
MLLHIDKLLKLSIALIITFLFTGCFSTSSYKYSNYNIFKKDRSSIHVPEEKIRNSKAMHRATMRPYKVFGKWYYPTLAKVGDTHEGISSWYGPNFNAKPTSNGEIYNMYKATAAHKTLPMNTMLKVENLENGKSTIVRVNDRGPFVGTRIIDLSNKAARDIDMVAKGTAKVRITVLGFHAKIAQTKEEKEEVASVGKYYLQVGAFSRYAGAQITQNKFKMILDSRYDVIIKKGILNNKEINRVWISGFRSEEEIRDFKEKNSLASAMVIAE